MAIKPCPDCGKDVSTMAAACPHCGYPLQEPPKAAAPAAAPRPAAAPQAPPTPRKGTSPWTIIGWIVLAMLALFLYTCTRAAMNLAEATSGTSSYTSPSGGAQAAKSYSVKIIDSGCSESASGRYTVIRATVENTGTETIPFAKAFFEAYDKSGAIIEAKDSYFSPSDIPPGARASADVMLEGDIARCGLVRMQGSGGASVTML